MSAGASGGDMGASAIVVGFKAQRLDRSMDFHNEIAPNIGVISRT